MLGLTQAQAQLLDFLERFPEENNGVCPTFDEMREHLGLASKSGVARLIDALEERGFIRRIPNRARCIEVTRHGIQLPELSRFSSDQLIAELARRSNQKREARHVGQ